MFALIARMLSEILLKHLTPNEALNNMGHSNVHNFCLICFRWLLLTDSAGKQNYIEYIRTIF